MIFPLAESMAFIGYTIILLVDKVMFDTHALWDEAAAGHSHDPVDENLKTKMKNSFAKAERTASMKGTDEAGAEISKEVDSAVKSYLNPNDRFAARMRSSLAKKSGSAAEDEDQKAMFVDAGNTAGETGLNKSANNSVLNGKAANA